MEVGCLPMTMLAQVIAASKHSQFRLLILLASFLAKSKS